MRHLKEYRVFESLAELTPEQVKFLDRYARGSWQLNSDGLVDVEGDFNCYGGGLKSLPVAFGSVSGLFNCSRNKLTSLEGAPGEVGDNFYCDDNRLTSLKGAPGKVGGNFYCDDNRLTSLEGAPEKVGGDFFCHNNPVESKTLRMIMRKLLDNPGMPYGTVLAALKSKIAVEDWDKLDRTAMQDLSDKAQRGYSLLGGLGGI
jgi:hypothetical protein